LGSGVRIASPAPVFLKIFKQLERPYYRALFAFLSAVTPVSHWELALWLQFGKGNDRWQAQVQSARVLTPVAKSFRLQNRCFSGMGETDGAIFKQTEMSCPVEQKLSSNKSQSCSDLIIAVS
jgi:hypothetical protein